MVTCRQEQDSFIFAPSWANESLNVKRYRFEGALEQIRRLRYVKRREGSRWVRLPVTFTPFLTACLIWPYSTNTSGGASAALAPLMAERWHRHSFPLPRRIRCGRIIARLNKKQDVNSRRRRRRRTITSWYQHNVRGATRGPTKRRLIRIVSCWPLGQIKWLAADPTEPPPLTAEAWEPKAENEGWRLWEEVHFYFFSLDNP